MQPGDLVKYTERHTGLQDLVGLVIETHLIRSGNRVRVLWSSPRPGPIRWDWAEELEAINESRR